MARFDLREAIGQIEKRGKKFKEVLDALDLVYEEYKKGCDFKPNETAQAIERLMALYGEWKNGG